MHHESTLRTSLSNMRRKFSQEGQTAMSLYKEKSTERVAGMVSRVSVWQSTMPHTGFLYPALSQRYPEWAQQQASLMSWPADRYFFLWEPHHTTSKAPTRHAGWAEQPAYILCLHPSISRTTSSQFYREATTAALDKSKERCHIRRATGRTYRKGRKCCGVEPALLVILCCACNPR
jgi:hypothetical protein